ncbi:S9 family peptidase [Bergeyella sp. RCAD1439]|uniref:S9 family peptidase n=1 Tax=Bergeyella anatis TaxID=3113737 RepID=UPI002E184096|nr:DPP IV N-terminal domain-containing protein [Bergeyella sp. RCAD1439]
MKGFRIFMLAMALGPVIQAQSQKFTMTEAVNGLRSNLAVKSVAQFSFAQDDKSSIHRTEKGYLRTDLHTMKQDTLLSLSQMNRLMPSDKTLKRLPSVTFWATDRAYFQDKGTYYRLVKERSGWRCHLWMALPENAANVQLSPEKNAAVYTVDNNLYYYENGVATAITEEKEPHIISGQSVHRNEFGIDGGIFWSPDRSQIAFYRMDERMVADYPIVDWSVTPAQNHTIKYPMAGAKSHEVSLGIYDVRTKTKRFLTIEGDKEQYLTAVTWSPDSKFIFVGVLNRAQNHLKMNQYDAFTGGFVKTLFEEKDEKYVEPQHSLLFLPGSTKEFIWQSQRTGYNHLFHYHLDKGLVAQLTKGDWLVTSVLGFNEKKKEVYFASTKETPLERHLYSVNWSTLKMQKLTAAPGMHTGVLSRSGNWLYDTYSNAETPRVGRVLNTQTLKGRTILEAEDPLVNYDRPRVQNVTLKAEDGTPLYGKLILPTRFEASKKYPVIVYLYNGPHVQLVTNGFPSSGNLWYEYLAQNGYVVFTMDGRGSSNRGLKFEQAVYGRLGTVEMDDQLKGVAYLKSLPFVDSERMGVHGWSFGGFMTTSLMLRHPDVFKVGVAGGPVMDWGMYEIMYTERYMGAPQNNPEGYKTANLLDKTANLKGNLLVIHGAQDDVVVWQHSINFLKSAVDHGVQVDYFVYPGHAHNVLGKDRVHLMQKVTDYFDRYLKD